MNFEGATQDQEVSERVDCDQLLLSQLVFQEGTSNPNRIQRIFTQIQTQRDDCISGIWNPVVDDPNLTEPNGCWESKAATETMNSPRSAT